jgi:hypothetical protein
MHNKRKRWGEVKFLKQLFCKHDWEIVKKASMFYSLNGEQLYKRCRKCEKVVEFICRKYEGNGYK